MYLRDALQSSRGPVRVANTVRHTGEVVTVTGTNANGWRLAITYGHHEAQQDFSTIDALIAKLEASFVTIDAHWSEGECQPRFS